MSATRVMFKSWDDVLSFAARGGRLFYQAPLDVYAVEVTVVKVYKNRKLRIDPRTRDADKCTADEGHLDRFRWCPPHQFAGDK